MVKSSVAGRTLIVLALSAVAACDAQSVPGDGTTGEAGEDGAGGSVGGSAPGGRGGSSGASGGNGTGGGAGSSVAGGSGGTAGRDQAGAAGSSSSAGAVAAGNGGTSGDGGTSGGAGGAPDECWETLATFCQEFECPATLDEGLAYMAAELCPTLGVGRKDGCGLVELATYPDLFGRSFVYDAETQELVGAVVHSDVAFGPCDQISYSSGLQFDAACAEQSSCEVCPSPGTAARPIQLPACEDGSGGSGGGGACVGGCEPQASGFCGEEQLTWVCTGSFDYQLFLDAGCSDPGTQVPRFCCDDGALAVCD